MINVIYVAVCGGGDCGEVTAQLAEAIGAELARSNAAVICGGGGGVMEAVSRGVNREGGIVLGILPGEDPRGGNEYLTAALATGMGEARNALIARSCDAVIAIGGEYGTLSEIALALKMGKPVVGINTWELYPYGKKGADSGITYTSTPEEAVEEALQQIPEW